MTDPRLAAPSEAELEAIEQGRTSAAGAIIGSRSRKRLIVAGPGTGKSFAFQESLRACGEKGLALTFIRNLVADLAHDLDGLADVFTLHGYCKHQLHRNLVQGLQTGWDYYPHLLDLLAEDMHALGRADSKADLERCLHNLEDGHGLVADAMAASEYYNAVSHTDLVFRVVRHFEANNSSVPEHPLIVVDEYQDFSLLETTFIRLLSDKSSVLIAGDDDQALYAFKNASARYIRDLADDDEYERFSLPYCSRCTQVIVYAVNDVITAAKDGGHLEGRLDKPFECYLPSKLAESNAHPTIIHARCTVERKNAPYGGRYIAKQIAEISAADIQESRGGGYPTVLVIGPKPFLGRAYETLKEQFPQAVLKVSPNQDVGILDGYRRIAKDSESRLGWRIVMHCDPLDNADALLAGALRDGGELVSALPDEYRDHHIALAALVERLLAEDSLSAEEQKKLGVACDLSMADIMQKLHVEDNDEDGEFDEDERAEDEPTILCTSLVGAKGLSASHVFVVGFNDGHFPRDPSAITNEEICCFLVALSRTRKQCHLVSCDRLGQERLNASRFARWISEWLEHVRVDAKYLAS